MLGMQCKKIFDGRKLPRDSKEQLRIVAVRRVMSGESPEAVAKGMGLNRRTIYRWLEAHYYGGEDALKAKPIPGAPLRHPLIFQTHEKVCFKHGCCLMYK